MSKKKGVVMLRHYHPKGENGGGLTLISGPMLCVLFDSCMHISSLSSGVTLVTAAGAKQEQHSTLWTILAQVMQKMQHLYHKEH